MTKLPLSQITCYQSMHQVNVIINDIRQAFTIKQTLSDPWLSFQ